jgi:hypothetical protein
MQRGLATARQPPSKVSCQMSKLVLKAAGGRYQGLLSAVPTEGRSGGTHVVK